MDKKLFVVVIAIGTIVVSTLLQLFMDGRELNPSRKRLLWISFAAGIVALLVILAFVR
jgi:hypothetical protein